LFANKYQQLVGVLVSGFLVIPNQLM